MNLKHCIWMAAGCLLLSSCSKTNQNQPQSPQTTGANVGSENNPQNAAPPPSQENTEQGNTPQQGNTPEKGTTQGAEQGNPPQGNPQQATPPTEGNMPGNTHEGTTENPSGMTGTGGTEMGTGAMATSTVDDPQIAEIVNETISDVLVQSRFATTHATDPRVKRYAQRLVAASGDEATKLTQVLQKASITPVATPISGQMNAQARDKFEALKAHGGADFDRAYVDNMVSTQRDVVDMIDNKLMPNVKSSDLKTNLGAIRTRTENHLRAAQDLQKALNK